MCRFSSSLKSWTDKLLFSILLILMNLWCLLYVYIVVQRIHSYVYIRTYWWTFVICVYLFILMTVCYISCYSALTTRSCTPKCRLWWAVCRQSSCTTGPHASLFSYTTPGELCIVVERTTPSPSTTPPNTPSMLYRWWVCLRQVLPSL